MGFIIDYNIDMINDKILEAFSILIEEFDQAIHEMLVDTVESKAYKNIDLITKRIEEIKIIQSEIEKIKNKWSNLIKKPLTLRVVEEHDSRKEKPQSSSMLIGPRSAYLKNINIFLNVELKMQTRSQYVDQRAKVAVVLLRSKEHPGKHYWFGVYPFHLEFLQKYPNGFIGLGCASPETILLIPCQDFLKWVDKLSKAAQRRGDSHWHTLILTEENRFLLRLEGYNNRVDLTRFLIKKSK